MQAEDTSKLLSNSKSILPNILMGPNLCLVTLMTFALYTTNLVLEKKCVLTLAISVFDVCGLIGFLGTRYCSNRRD